MSQDPWKVDTLTVVYAGEAFPTTVKKTIMLCGPTPRDPQVKSWRPEALRLLEKLGYDGHVFVPENRTQGPYDYLGQVEWEYEALNRADSIVFWVPRDMKDMPALTTNIEWGLWCDSGKAVFGAPDSAENVRYMKWQAGNLKVPMFNELTPLLEHSIKSLGKGSERTGGEAKVPLHVWNHPTFQGWLRAQKAAGNRLDDAKVLWSFRVGPKRNKVFSWAVQVSVWVLSEGRHKSNEFVLGRTDIACVVLYCHDSNYLDTDFVLVREFRSPARTPNGCILELPGGGVENGIDPETTAIKELREETGFSIESHRLRPVGSRQLAGTLSAHVAHVYAAEITPEELEHFKSQAGEVLGEEGGEERTSIVVTPLRSLLKDPNSDWATLGMVFASL
jgi:8-oxo-dGTP pyrophosphatase MutT (NUDIX family)